MRWCRYRCNVETNCHSVVCVYVPLCPCMLKFIYVHIHLHHSTSRPQQWASFSVFLRNPGARTILAVVEGPSFLQADCGMTRLCACFWLCAWLPGVCAPAWARLERHNTPHILQVSEQIQDMGERAVIAVGHGGTASTKVPSLVHSQKNCERRELRSKVPWKNWKNWKIDVQMCQYFFWI
jgi:hypothetical protein